MYTLIDRKIEGLKFSGEFGGRLKKAFDPCFAEHERNQNFKEDGLRFQIGVLKQKKRDLLKEDFQHFSRAEIEEVAGELQSDINRLHDELKAAGLEENKIISEIFRRIEEVRDLPQRYLEAADTDEKAGILRELVSLLTLTDSEIQISWKEPYSYLMRDELLVAAGASGVAAAGTPDAPARPEVREMSGSGDIFAPGGLAVGEGAENSERNSATSPDERGSGSWSGKRKRGKKGRFERNYENTGGEHSLEQIVDQVKNEFRMWMLTSVDKVS